MDNFEIVIQEDQVGVRIDHFLLESLEEVSRSKLQKWIQSGVVWVNGSPCKKNYLLRRGDVLVLNEIPLAEEIKVEPEEMPLDIEYEDEDLMVIFKPKGLVVHPGNGITSGTLVSGLLHYCQNLSGLNGMLRPGIVHRLDKDTTGLMVVAKNDHSHALLADQLKDRSLTRIYNAVVWGHLFPPEGTVENNLARDPRNRLKIKVQYKGRLARTHYKTLEFYPGASLLEFKLDTGRTHQIRVHSSYLGHPILGDSLYGGGVKHLEACQPLDRPLLSKAVKGLNSQALVAKKIAFIHPRTKEQMEFERPLDGEMKDLVELLRTEAYEQKIGL